MKFSHLLFAVPVCTLGLGRLGAVPVKYGAVEAELVPAVASIQPGHAFDVALRLAHDPHWHTYWINAGTGYPTKIKWRLPPGWQAGDIQWPVPHVLKDSGGNITGNGYDGEVFLLVTLTPPADLSPGTSVTLKAAVEWLMCADVCKPGQAALELTLPVEAGPPAPDPQWGDKLAAARWQLPHAPDHWQLAATRAAKAVTLTVRAPAGSAFAPGDFHFFADDGLIAYEQPQPVNAAADGAFVFTLPVDPASPPEATRLIGVLALDKGDVPGIRVDVPLGAAGAAASIKSQVSSSKTGGVAGGGFFGTLVLALVGGLILNLMPCVFPVLGIKILGFVNQAGADRRKVTLHGLVFALGVLLSFWLLAGALLALRAGGRELGWGFQLQEPAFVFALAALLLVFALNLSGLFEIGLSVMGVGSQLQAKSGYSGSFFTGVLATVVATPCSAPFLAPALGAALTLSAVESITVFTTIALGLSAPYLLLSIFPGAVKLLPRPGAWMETFKQLMAFPLYATVGFLVWVLAGQTPDTGLLKVLFGLVLVAMAAWAYGRWTQHGGSAGRRRFGYAFAAALFAAGLALGYPAKPAQDIVWEKWSPETVAKLRAEGKTLYVDFTARWCATCQSNKAVVFSSQKVRDVLRQQGVVLLRADWTNKDPLITETLAAFNRSAVPFDLIYAPGRAEPLVLPELLTPDIVLNALAKAAQKELTGS
ncbi:MAG TPA: protein-disulfide reductase DsbD domain-containing protein [Opitutaceae bacterium]|nr:protein-disulfide reductase DsbD domain-containing protein [Opitutaceae bacterium]